MAAGELDSQPKKGTPAYAGKVLENVRQDWMEQGGHYNDYAKIVGLKQNQIVQLESGKLGFPSPELVDRLEAKLPLEHDVADIIRYSAGFRCSRSIHSFSLSNLPSGVMKAAMRKIFS